MTASMISLIPMIALRSVTALGLGLALVLAHSAQAQDDTLTLLTIEGDRIGLIATPDATIDPGRLLESYYALLPAAVRDEALSLRAQLKRLIPDYNVAYTAADAAELTQVKSDIDALMAGVHGLHAAYFTSEVEAMLNAAIDAVLVLVGPNP
jgi:hypothetical protein